MAAVILIAFLAIVAVLGGWWLKTERERQKKDLIKQGGIASGKLDDSLLPKKKPEKRKRKKREANWFDPKYVPPEIPDKAMLDTWLAGAVKLVDELMPMAVAYRKSTVKAEPIQSAMKAASTKLISYYPQDAVTMDQAHDWYTTMEERVNDFLVAKAAVEQANSELRGQFKPTADKVNALGLHIHHAESWELYKAPEAFHEKLELIQLLHKQLASEFDFSSAPKLAERVETSWRKRRNWARWNEPEEALVEDTGIVTANRDMMLEALAHVAALQAAVKEARQVQSEWADASKNIALARPAKPADEEVEALLAEAIAWSKNRDAVLKQARNAAKALRQKQEATGRALSQLNKAADLLKDAAIPQSDKNVKEALDKALIVIQSHYNTSGEGLSSLLALSPEPSPKKAEELQAESATAAKLRALMRKAAFGITQFDAAKRSLEAAQADKPQLGETTPPVLTQSSAAAFVNAHGRMNEIIARNDQKKEAHSTKVRQLDQQRAEREQQMKQGLEALNTEVKATNAGKYAAEMAIIQPAATLFASAF